MDAAAEPVRNAIVTITAPELARGRSVMTDDAGRFAFANLPAALYTVTAEKASYVTTAFGAKRPGRPGTPVQIAANQSIADLVVPLARGAVITGRVTRPNGQPASFVPMLALPARDLRAGTASPDAADQVFSDDRGVYRIFGLAPGAYVVIAMMGSGERDAPSTTDVDAALARLQQRLRDPMPTGGLSGVPTGPPRSVVLAAPVFFPGTASGDEAQPVTVAIGEERAGVDMIVAPARAHTVEGVIVSGDSSSLEGVGLAMIPGGLRMPTGIGAAPRLTMRPGADGRFQLAGVAPGRHTLIAWTTTKGAPQLLGRGGAPATPLVTALYASADLAANHDLTGVVLTLAPVGRFAGRVVFDGSSAPPADLTTMRLTLQRITPGNVPIPLNGISTAGLGRPASALLAADGRFDIANVMPNTYALALTIPGATPGAGWWLRSAMAGGRDLLDTFYEPGGGAGLTTAVLTLTDRHTALTGTLQTPAGQPASDCFIVVFTTDRALWLPQARRVRSTRPGTDGSYTFADLPPGEYFLAALTDIDQDEWREPEFLSQVAAAGAIRLAIGDGERKVQHLQLAKAPRLRTE
jgi:hypothetical protein